jgi:phosphocarrier protein FPr
LAAEKVPHRWPIETGIMIEIPAAALLSPRLAPIVDFFSIGTNDLTQYTLAAERGNPNLSGLADALHPSVLQLIGQVSAAAHQHGKWVGVCGELAGDPLAVPILLGLKVDELSLNPGGIPAVKAILRQLDDQMVQPLVAQALQAENADAVRRLAGQFYDQVIKPGLS